MAIIDNRERERIYKTVRYFSKDRNWLNRLNDTEVDKLRHVIEVTLNELKLNQDKRFVKISKTSFTNNQKVTLTETQTISFLNILTEQIGLFMVVNDEIAIYIEHNNANPFINKAQSVEGQMITPQSTGFTRFDLQDKILLVLFYPEKALAELKRMSKLVGKKARLETNIQKIKPNLPYPDKSKWHVDEKKSFGRYEVPSGEFIHFRSGYFGGMNELIKHSGSRVSREQLRAAIEKHMQGKGRSANEINLSDWKHYIMKKRKDSSKYFYIETEGSYYKLYIKQ